MRKMGQRAIVSAELFLDEVRVPADRRLGEEGGGFRGLMRTFDRSRVTLGASATGLARAALEYATAYAKERTAFGKPIAEHDVTLERIAESRIEIDQARLSVLRAAYMMDTVGNKAAKSEIAQIKVLVPNMTLRVLDRAIQVHGGGGVSQEFWLAFAWAHSRTLRFADGPDEVHRRQIARLELRKYS
jgi:acyl-CoA dehydrogenase